MSTPLRDLSGGRLKAWPGGGIVTGDGYLPLWRPEADPDWPPSAIVMGGAGRWVYCKYCYKSTLPLTVHAHGFGVGEVCSEQVICSECAYGLSEPVESVEAQARCPDPDGKRLLDGNADEKETT